MLLRFFANNQSRSRKLSGERPWSGRLPLAVLAGTAPPTGVNSTRALLRAPAGQAGSSAGARATALRPPAPRWGPAPLRALEAQRSLGLARSAGPGEGCLPGDWPRGAPVTVQLARRPAPAPPGPKQRRVRCGGSREEAGWDSWGADRQLVPWWLRLRRWRALVESQSVSLSF